MAENSTHRISADDLSAFVKRLFLAADTPDDIAECAARILVNADLAGHPSHGVLRIPDYLRQIEAGGMDTSARPEITRESPGTAGNWSAGTPAVEKILEIRVHAVTPLVLFIINFILPGFRAAFTGRLLMF